MDTYKEILIIYSKIDDAINHTGSYLASLDRVESAIDDNSKLLEDQRGETFVMLEERRNMLKKTIAVRREQTQDLRTSLMNYRDAMNALIHPVTRGADVRVNEDDINAKLGQIKTDVRDVFLPKIYPPNQTDPYQFWVSDEDGGGHWDTDQAKIDREMRNGSKVDGFQDYNLSGIERVIEDSIAALDQLNKNNIQAFVKMDGEQAALAQTLYDKYKDFGMQQYQNFAMDEGGFAAGVFLDGLIGGAVDMVKGFGELGYTIGGIIATGVPSLLGYDPPVWAQMVTNNLTLAFADVQNPLDFFKKIGEGIGQDYVGKYNEGGVAYVLGYGAFDAITIFLGFTKLGKIGKLGEFAEETTKGAEVVKVLDSTKVVTELVDAGKISKFDLWQYLSKIDSNAAHDYLTTGKWPKDVQIPVSSKVLKADGTIDWKKLAPQNGYVLDASGNAIKKPYLPQIGKLLDRFGPPDGRFTCPVEDGTPYSYTQRSLPYVEDASQYHQYEVVGDIKNIKEYVDKCADLKVKAKIEDTVNKLYDGDYTKLAESTSKGEVASIKSIGTEGGAEQVELPLTVDQLEKIGILKEIK